MQKAISYEDAHGVKQSVQNQLDKWEDSRYNADPFISEWMRYINKQKEKVVIRR